MASMLILTDDEDLMRCAWCGLVLHDGARMIVEGRLTPDYSKVYCRMECLEAQRTNTPWVMWGPTTDYQRALYAEICTWDQGQPETWWLSYGELTAFAMDVLYVRGLYDEAYVQQILTTNRERREKGT